MCCALCLVGCAGDRPAAGQRAAGVLLGGDSGHRTARAARQDRVKQQQWLHMLGLLLVFTITMECDVMLSENIHDAYDFLMLAS